MNSYLIPRFEWMGWCTDGLHGDDGAPTHAEGYSLAFAWLGLHLEIIFAVEKRPRAPRCDGCGETRPIREILDGDRLCQSCCDKWVRAEGQAEAEASDEQP